MIGGHALRQLSTKEEERECNEQVPEIVMPKYIDDIHARAHRDFARFYFSFQLKR